MKRLILAVLMLLSIFSVVVSAGTDCVDCYGEALKSPKLDIEECVVRVNDRIVKNDVTYLKAYERGDDLEVTVEFTSHEAAEDVQIMAFLTGHHRGHRVTEELIDVTPSFTIKANTVYERVLNLKLPEDFHVKGENADELKLRVVISDKYSSTFIKEYNLRVEALRESVVIQDVILDPYSEVQAGRGLFASVRVENLGQENEEDLKIEVGIPALGLRAVEYIDELEIEEATTSEDLFIRVPVCTKPGTYVVRADVTYAYGDEIVSQEKTMTVTENPACDNGKSSDKTVISVLGRQSIQAGSNAVFPVVIKNNGGSDKTYELSVNGVSEWGNAKFSPSSLVIVQGGSSATVFLNVEAMADATSGEKVFVVGVKSGETGKQFPVIADVTAVAVEEEAEETVGITRFLEIGVIILVVILVLVALFVGFMKMKDNQDEDDEMSGQQYY